MNAAVLWILMLSNTPSDAGNHYGSPSAVFFDRSDCEASIPWVRKRLREIYAERPDIPPPEDFIYCREVALRKESVR